MTRGSVSPERKKGPLGASHGLSTSMPVALAAFISSNSDLTAKNWTASRETSKKTRRES